jgi:hypothetical protein
MEPVKENNKQNINQSILRVHPLNKEIFENQKTIASLYVVLTLFSISFFGFFAINPTLSTISLLNKKHEDMQLVNQKLDEKITALENLSTQYQQIYPLLDDRVYAAVPSTSKAAYVLRQIETIIQERNLEIITIQTDNVEIFPAVRSEDKNYQFSTTLQIKGTIDEGNELMNELINIDRLVNITEFSLSADREEEGVFTIVIKGISYFNKI